MERQFSHRRVSSVLHNCQTRRCNVPIPNKAMTPGSNEQAASRQQAMENLVLHLSNCSVRVQRMNSGATTGYHLYHAVPGNLRRLNVFRQSDTS
jgi:hypothetical protein